jgi:hypothetical protein
MKNNPEKRAKTMTRRKSEKKKRRNEKRRKKRRNKVGDTFSHLQSSYFCGSFDHFHCQTILFMKNLPVEIIQQIYLLLVFSDSLSLAKAAKFLYVIFKGCYYHNAPLENHSTWIKMGKFPRASLIDRFLKIPYLNPAVDHGILLTACRDTAATDVLQLILEDGRIDPGVNSNVAIRCASAHGHTAAVRLLLASNRVNPSEGDNWALRWACLHGYLEIVAMLVKDRRVDVSAGFNHAKLPDIVKILNEATL